MQVKGYTPLSDVQKSEMNILKELEERTLRFIETRHTADPRSVAIAITQLQGAFMWANRAIAKPQRVTLMEDPPTENDETSNPI